MEHTSRKRSMRPALVWKVGQATYRCPVLPDACGFCGKRCIVVLPPPVAAEQNDGTTHVCHPSIGGCNQGFESTRPFEQAKDLRTEGAR